MAWNLWPDTLWEQPYYKWRSGDLFLVYPGETGPIDSIRWEMFREGIEDYECLWMARQGVERLRAAGGHAEFLERAEKTLTRAVDLATQQHARTRIPLDPIPARIPEARGLVNDLLVEIAGLEE